MIGGGHGKCLSAKLSGYIYICFVVVNRRCHRLVKVNVLHCEYRLYYGEVANGSFVTELQNVHVIGRSRENNE